MRLFPFYIAWSSLKSHEFESKSHESKSHYNLQKLYSNAERKDTIVEVLVRIR